MTPGNPPPDLRARAVEDAAAEWVARLALGNLTREDLTHLRTWLAEDPAHQQAFDNARAAWAELSPTPQPASVQGRRRFTLAAAAVAACLLLFVSVPRLIPHAFASPTGEVHKTTLPDGSALWLDSGAAADFRMDEKTRTLTLVRGRAHIAVAANPGRTLTVNAAEYEIRDIGTAFTVDIAGDELRVAVAEGSVEVRRRSSVTAITAGRAASFSAEHAGPLQPFSPAREAAWRDGHIVLDRTTLADALKELDRYRVGRIVLLDDSLGSRVISGTLSTDDIEGGLAALAATQKLQLTHLPFLLLVRSRDR